MNVELIESTYHFSNANTQEVFLKINFTKYPDCCIMGILHQFSIRSYAEFNNHLEEVRHYLIGIMPSYEINQLLIADTNGGAGYRIAEGMPEAHPINIAFNNNSGNYVYTFAIYN